MKAVVLLSGGMDSTTALAQAIKDGATDVIAVSARYGSKHMQAEQQAAAEVVNYFSHSHGIRIQPLNVTLPDVFLGNGANPSALMGETEMPHISYQEIQQTKGPSPTVVPFRNANLISAAVAVAAAQGYDFVYCGMHAEDAANWAYPDCTPEFLGAMANAVFIGTYMKVRLVFPFIWMTKGEIVTRAAKLMAPLGMTWSCYDPVWTDGDAEAGLEGSFAQCGKCPTCIERMEAFRQAGYRDPQLYNDLPDGDNEYVRQFGELKSWPV